MATTLQGSVGTTGSLTLSDASLLTSTTQPLTSSKTVVAVPANIPANSSASGWNLNQIYSNSFYKSTLTSINSTTGTSLTLATLGDALCGSANCTRIQAIQVTNLGAESLKIQAAAFTDGNITVPPYGDITLRVPMNGVAVSGTITFRSGANTTSAFVTIANNNWTA
jgi:hypothetical protein